MPISYKGLVPPLYNPRKIHVFKIFQYNINGHLNQNGTQISDIGSVFCRMVMTMNR